MWIRMMLLAFTIGCMGADPRDPPTAIIATSTTVPFECLNDTTIHILVCHGSVSVFPITITVEDLRILSDNELSILSDDLNDVAILDGGTLDNDKILSDLEDVVFDDLLDELDILVTKDDIDVCTAVSGIQLCK